MTAKEQDAPIEVFRPLDWGLSFVVANYWRLLLFAIAPFFVKVVILALQHSRALDSQEVFLLTVLYLMAASWLLAVVQMFCFDFWLDRDEGFVSLSLRATGMLPKVFLSFAVLMALISLAEVALPAVVAVVFCIWSPLFCIGETYLEEEVKDKEATAEKDEMEEVFSMGEIDGDFTPTFFKGKGIWELGFVRSVVIAGRGLSGCFQVAFLFWLAHLIPSLSSELLAGPYPSLMSQLVKAAFISIFEVLACGVAAGAFLVMLPPEARAEISLPTYVEPKEVSEGRMAPAIFLEGRVVPYILLSFFVLILVSYTEGKSKNQPAVPASVLSEVERVEVKRNLLKVRLRLSDSKYRFRWVNPEKFAVVFVPDSSAKKDSDMEEEVSMSTSSVVDDAPAGDLLYAKNVIAFDRKEVAFSDLNFAPYFFPVLFDLSFKLPSSSAKKPLSSAEIELYYAPEGTKPALLSRESFGDRW